MRLRESIVIVDLDLKKGVTWHIMVMDIMSLVSQSHFYLSFIFIQINICNDQVNYDEIIIQ